jgi:hypothetical protein
MMKAGGRIQQENALIVVALKRHESGDARANFLEARLCDGIIGAWELVGLAVESVDVEEEGVADVCPGGIDADALAQAGDDCVVGDGGEGGEVCAGAGDACCRWGCHAVCVAASQEGDGRGQRWDEGRRADRNERENERRSEREAFRFGRGGASRACVSWGEASRER